jgi:spore germination cell wall hydrolase CwlJ-like protein
MDPPEIVAQHSEVDRSLAPAPEAGKCNQEVGIEPGATLAETVANLQFGSGSRELECLAGAICFQIRAKAAGQLAVGHVIANRASGRFPASYCR